MWLVSALGSHERLGSTVCEWCLSLPVWTLFWDLYRVLNGEEWLFVVWLICLEQIRTVLLRVHWKSVQQINNVLDALLVITSRGIVQLADNIVLISRLLVRVPEISIPCPLPWDIWFYSLVKYVVPEPSFAFESATSGTFTCWLFSSSYLLSFGPVDDVRASRHRRCINQLLDCKDFFAICLPTFRGQQ